MRPFDTRRRRRLRESLACETNDGEQYLQQVVDQSQIKRPFVEETSDVTFMDFEVMRCPRDGWVKEVVENRVKNSAKVLGVSRGQRIRLNYSPQV